VLCQSVHAHALGDRCSDNRFQRVFGMVAELARVAVVREGHGDGGVCGVAFKYSFSDRDFFSFWLGLGDPVRHAAGNISAGGDGGREGGMADITAAG
jgi:hypothetical protein